MTLVNAGAALATMSALVALARMDGLGGLAGAPSTARLPDAAAFAALVWTVAVMLPAARALLSAPRVSGLDPAFLDYATAFASLASLGLSIASAAATLRSRRLELGVADRATSALVLSATALAIGVLGALASVAPPERLLPTTASVAAVAIAASAVSREPTALVRAMRLILALSITAAPVAVVFVVIAQTTPGRAGATVFAASAAAAVAGLAAPTLARRFAPNRGRWLTLLASATRAAMNPDPDAALDAALFALADAGGKDAAPALYRLHAAEKVTVDRAGYTHVRPAALPPEIVELTSAEPERILRIEVAQAACVRHPNVRPVAAWLEEEGLAAVAILSDDDSPSSLLAIPHGARTAPATLEEVRALRTLADRLGAVISVSEALARSRTRELGARLELQEARAAERQVSAIRDRDAARVLATTQGLERPARLAAYSPAARTTVEQLERLGAEGRPIGLVSAPGVDVVAWAALAHLASTRRRGPFTVIDGANTAEHDLLRWRSPGDSPLGAASGGSLFVQDAHALPEGVQSYIGAALPDDVSLIVSIPGTVDAMLASGQIQERLADRLRQRTVALPSLASRGEDLRALASEYLARLGVRLRNRPLGLAPPALAALLDHTWPGNDAELYATLLCAALVAETDVIDVEDLRRGASWASARRPR
jgi:hypothetical protein